MTILPVLSLKTDFEDHLDMFWFTTTLNLMLYLLSKPVIGFLTQGPSLIKNL